jgi:PiT family inorganic phosphate transporter
MTHLHVSTTDTIPYCGDRRVQRDRARHAAGGWRIVHNDGIAHQAAAGGWVRAETGGALSIPPTRFGILVSTTHTITGAIVVAGTTRRLSAVRWGLAGRTVWA